MKTIVVTAQKGGSGKTTLVRNLATVAAAEGKRVLMLDLDPQQSLRRWWAGRTSEQPTMLEDDPTPQMLKQTLKMVEDHFDFVLIDTPPAAPEWLGEIVDSANLALIPVKPSPDDLRAVGATLRSLSGLAYAFVMMMTPRAKITEEAARTLAQHGRVAPVNIGIRVSYAETGATGEGVCETKDKKASEEMTELWDYVSNLAS